MMASESDPLPLCEEPSPVVLRELQVRSLQPHEYARANQMLDAEHYLGEPIAVGKSLFQVVHHHGRWVALVHWGPPAMKLADREEWIGWTDLQRSQRLGLIVQNRRFLVLSQTRMPNLASRALTLATNALPQAWRERFGYAPLLAETFTDIEQFEGTCYKAAGWQPCGMTRGFSRHRADFYVPNQRPKKLWIKTLNRNARSILTAMDLPKAYAAAENLQSPERALPLKASQIQSLQQALRAVPDPRARNRTFGCSSLLSLIAMALLAGRTHLAQIHRFGQYLTQPQRKRLGFPRKSGSKLRRAPSYKALRNLLIQLDPHALAATLTQWLQTHHGTLPRALALDGKYVRDLVLTVCLSDHQTGAPVAIAIADPAPRTEDNKKEGELTAARRLFEQCNLNNAIITADALHCERKGAANLPEAGADFVFQLKENQPRATGQADKIVATQTPLFPSRAWMAGMAASIGAASRSIPSSPWKATFRGSGA